MDKINQSHHSIVVFDGLCNLCNTSVNFIIARDNKNRFKFLPMQSGKGQKFLAKHHISSDCIDTLFLVSNNEILKKSNAVLAIAQELKMPWNWFAILKIIPESIRNFFYSLIAKNRYKWFGKKQQCMIPIAELHDKFLT
jgi:predicted DCC family thiol-disulfide oxidoreductase YuxK